MHDPKVTFAAAWRNSKETGVDARRPISRTFPWVENTEDLSQPYTGWEAAE